MRYTLPLDELRKAPFVGPRGGLWADVKHTVHWNPEKHAATKPIFVAADLIPRDDMESIIDKLVKLPLDKLKSLLAQIAGRKKEISTAGEGVPVSLVRWGRAVQGAIDIVGAKKEATSDKPEQLPLVIVETAHEAAKDEPVVRDPDPVLPAMMTTAGVAKLFEEGDERAAQAAADFVGNADTPRAKKTRTNALRKLGIVYSKGEWRNKPVPTPRPKAAKKPAARKKAELPTTKPTTNHQTVGEHIGGSRKEKAVPLGPKGSRYVEFAGMDDTDVARMARKSNLMDEINPAQMMAEGRDPAYVMVRAVVEKMIPQQPKIKSREMGEYYIKGIAFLQKGLDRCETEVDIREFILEWKNLAYGMRKVAEVDRTDGIYKKRDEKLKADGYKLLMTHEEYLVLDKQTREAEEARNAASVASIKNPSEETKEEHIRTAKLAQDLYRQRTRYMYGNVDGIDAMYINDTVAYIAGVMPVKKGPHVVKTMDFNDAPVEVEQVGDKYIVFQRDPELKKPGARNPFEAKAGPKTMEEAKQRYNEYFLMAGVMGDQVTRTIQYGGNLYGKAAKKWRDAHRVTRDWQVKERTGSPVSDADKLAAIEKVTARKSRASEAFRWRHTFTGRPERVGGKLVKKGDAKAILREFKFRGVEIGEWVNNEEAEHHLMAAQGGLSDLADVLGLEPQRLALGGRLALAIGSRGKGWGAAHYEPDREVINITKFAGGGSLAHEWGHAMDNMLAKWALPKGRQSVVATPEGVRGVFVTLGDVPDADKDLITAMNRLQSYMTWGEADAYIKLNEHSELQRKPYYERTNEEKLALIKLEGELRSISGSTYYKSSRAMTKSDSGYWTSPEEMFARAFESYVHDKLADDGRVNTYLASGTTREEIREAEKRTRIGTKEREIKVPYPEGEERQALKALFDDLIGVVRSKELLKKAFMSMLGLADTDVRFVVPV